MLSHLSVCLCVCLCVYVCVSMCLCVCVSDADMSACVESADVLDREDCLNALSPVCVSVCLSVCVCVYVSVCVCQTPLCRPLLSLPMC